MSPGSSPTARRLKVMLLVPTLDQSGAEKQLTLLACRLSGGEFDVHVVALARGGPFADELQQHGVRLTVLGKCWKFDPRAWWRLRRLIRFEQPEILHTWLFAANAYGRLAVARGMLSRPKVIVSERCVDVWKSGWQLWLDRRLIKRTDRLIGNSQAVAEFYRQLGFPSERIAVIPNGVEIPEPLPFDRDAVLREFDIPPGSPVIGFIGRLAKQKRVDDLVWTMALLIVLQPDVHLLLIGDGPERDKLTKFARDIKVDEATRFTGHRPDAAKLLRVMNVFWLASDFEGLSNSLMEAMAAGVPVVVSNIPPNRELVVDGETGFLVNVGDRVAFQQFTERLLADPKLAKRMGDAGRERMRRHFSIDSMVAAHAKLYREVAAIR
jgi:glycosyltransferase involved in cell wall biosynthesis